MIERMKKVTLIVPERDAGSFVERLREAGVLHVQHVDEPVDHDTHLLEDRIGKLERLSRTLERFDGHAPHRDALPCTGGRLMDLADDIMEKAAANEGLKERIASTTRELARSREWGGVTERDIDALRGKGLFVMLAEASRKEFSAFKTDPRVYPVNGQGKTVRFAIIAEERPGFADSVTEAAPPQRTEKAIADEIRKLEERADALARELGEEAGCLEAIEGHRAALAEALEFSRVKAGMKSEGRLSYVRGWCPAGRMGRIERLAEEAGSGYLSEDPEPSDQVPTHITNPYWIRMIEPVFDFMRTVPGYREMDISFFFLVFFSLFFAMLIGDAGYGTLFLACTFFARRKIKKAPREVFSLLYVLSSATIIWGALTGTWFGLERIATLPVFRHMIIEPVNSFAEASQDNVLYLSFLIGAVQLSLAHIVRAVRMMNSPKAVAQLGWVAVIWSMFHVAGNFVLGRSFPAFAGWSLLLGAVAILFFQNYRRDILKGALTTLTELPLSIIGSFSDVVSYLRLFAVGYATVVLAVTVNEMALGLGAGSVLAGLGAGLILVVGHLLNIALAIMAVVVHGIRLNMLEFSSHLGMQWTGLKYRPFGRKTV